MNWEYLVALDIGGIHEYIFGTNKLREIRGASILLDRLNRELPLKKLSNSGSNGVDWKSVVMAGGNIKVCFKDKGKAESYRKYLTDLFKEEAPDAKVTVIISERKGENENLWLKETEKELKRAKSLHKERTQVLSCGFFKVCDACGLYPAEEEDIRPEGVRYICKSCFKKVEQSKSYLNTETYKRLKKNGRNLTLPDDFSQIGKASEPEGYMGFIYADGNRMGEYLANITSFDELNEFSSDVHKATLEATVSSINKYFPDSYLPMQLILAGGDDLILALPANKAIDVAIDFCEDFNNNLSSRKITTCAGIVICHDSLPIKTVLNTAKALLKNAKAESRKNGNKTFIDFVVVTGSAIEDPVSKRKRELIFNDRGEHHLTERPYSLEDLKDLRDTIKEFKRRDFPKNKLRLLYSSLFRGHYQSILDACYMKTRLSKEHKKLICDLKLDRFPWKELKTNEYETPFGDIAELYEFITS